MHSKLEQDVPMLVLLQYSMRDHPGKTSQLIVPRASNILLSLMFSYLEVPNFFSDEQRLTNSALLYSKQLSPIDQHLVKQFNKGSLPSVTCI